MKVKKILSCVLVFCMLLSMLPTVSYATDGTTTQESTSVPITTLYVSTVAVVEDGVAGTVSGDGWSFDAETATLTVSDGAHINGDASASDYVSCGIYCDGDLNIVLNGDLTLSGRKGGIRMITGSLSIDVQSGTTTIYASTSYYGLTVQSEAGDLSIHVAEDAVLTIRGYGGGDAICAAASDKTLAFSGKGTVNATGKSLGGGIYATNDCTVTVDGITLNCSGGPGAASDFIACDVYIGRDTPATVNLCCTTAGRGMELGGQLGIYNGSVVTICDKTAEGTWKYGIEATVVAVENSTLKMGTISGTSHSNYGIIGNLNVSGSSHIVGAVSETNTDSDKGFCDGTVTVDGNYYYRTDSAGEFAYNKIGTNTGAVYFELITQAHLGYHNNGDTHSYGCADTDCLACVTVSEGNAHDYTENDGNTCVCGAYKPATLNADNVYEIGTWGELMWFAEFVNNGNYDADAVLTADINVDTLYWKAIGRSSGTAYTGTFDGKGFRIQNINRNNGMNEGTRESFAYYVGEGGCIKNVIFEAPSVFCQGHAGANASAVVALHNAGTISGCTVIGGVIQLGNYAYLGGIAGVNANGGVIENCGVVATELTRRFGRDLARAAIVHQNNGTVRNCFAYECVYNTTNAANGGIIAAGNAPENCYYYTANTVASTYATAVTAEQFAAGEVTYLLNGDQSSIVWKQTLGADDYPNFTGETVYQVLNCNGETIYRNVNENISHAPDENGYCPLCETTYVAVVNDIYYTSLGDAINAANAMTQNGALCHDGSILAQITVIADAELKTDTEEWTLWEGTTLTVNEGVTVTVNSLSIRAKLTNNGTIAGFDETSALSFNANYTDAPTDVTGGSFEIRISNNGGVINSGSFFEEVSNGGTIVGGTFSKTVTLWGCSEVKGGTFEDIIFENGTIAYTSSAMTVNGAVYDYNLYAENVITIDGEVHTHTEGETTYRIGDNGKHLKLVACTTCPFTCYMVTEETHSFENGYCVCEQPESYEIYVDGTQVTAANASDVLGDGTVGYDHGTQTLTLNNASISNKVFWDSRSCAIYTTLDELNLVLIGDNTLISSEAEDYSVTLWANQGLNISGSGTLTITCPNVENNLSVVAAELSIAAESTLSANGLVYIGTLSAEGTLNAIVWSEVDCAITVYGRATLDTDLTVRDGYSGNTAFYGSFTVSEGAKLTIADGVTLTIAEITYIESPEKLNSITNNGKISLNGSGTIVNHGTGVCGKTAFHCYASDSTACLVCGEARVYDVSCSETSSVGEKYYLSNLTATYGQDYSAYLYHTAGQGNAWYVAVNGVTVNGQAVEYSFTLASGLLTIAAEYVTGDIVIDVTVMAKVTFDLNGGNVTDAFGAVLTAGGIQITDGKFSVPSAYGAVSTLDHSSVFVRENYSFAGLVNVATGEPADTSKAVVSCELQVQWQCNHSIDSSFWIAATCTEPKCCSVCGVVEGEPQHSWSDNVCTACGAEAQAEILKNGESVAIYTSLSDAIDVARAFTAEDHAVVKLLRSVDVGSSSLVIYGGSYTLDLNDFTLTSSAGSSGAIELQTSGPIEIINGTVCGNHCAIQNTSGTLILTDLNLSAYYGVVNSGETTVIDCTIEECSVCISADSGRVEIYNSSLSGSVSDLDVRYGELALYEGTIFTDGFSFQSFGATIHDILGDGMAYWQGNTMLSPAEDVVLINGFISVKAACLHEAAEKTVIAPTCTIYGYTTVNCAACGYDSTLDYIDATGHSYGEDGVCTACGANTGETIVLSLHDSYGDGWNGNAIKVYGNGILLTTATFDDGYSTQWSFSYEPTVKYELYWVAADFVDECSFKLTVADETKLDVSDCSIYPDGYRIYPVCEHVYESVVVTDVTCTEAGYTTYTCSLCGLCYTGDYVDALGHSKDESSAVLTAPTCTEDGYTTYTCLRCSEAYTDNYVDALGHSKDESSAVVTAPTCTEDGYTTCTCLSCGEELRDSYVPHLGHTLGEDGNCTVCGELYSVPVWITGVQITSENMADVLSDATVSYYPATNTLTLNGFAYEGDANAVYCEIPLNIVLKGENSVTTEQQVFSFMYVSGNITVSGDGTLNAVCYDEFFNVETFGDASVTVCGPVGIFVNSNNDEGFRLISDSGAITLTVKEKAIVTIGTEETPIREECVYLSAATDATLLVTGNACFSCVTEDEEGVYLIAANESVLISGEATFCSEAEEEGIDADTVTISGGSVSITSSDMEAIYCEKLAVKGGKLTLETNAESTPAVFATDEVSVTGGELDVLSGGIAVSGDGGLTPGTITIGKGLYIDPVNSSVCNTLGEEGVYYYTGIVDAQGDELAVFTVKLCTDHDWIEATCTESKTCSVCGKTEGEALGHSDTDGNNICDTCTEALPDAYLRGKSLSLNGDIAINFYMHLSEKVLADESAYMEFTKEDGTVLRIPVAQASLKKRSTEDYYVFTVPMLSIEMADVVKAQFFWSEGSTEVYTYSVKTYVDNMLPTCDDDALADLLVAMLHYGAAAQIQFGYRTDHLANDGLEAPDYSAVSIEGFEADVGDATELLRYYGATLQLNSRTALKFVFVADASLQEITVTCNGESVEWTREGNYICVIIDDICAKDLDEFYTLTVSDGTDSIEVRYSPMSYCQNVLNKNKAAFTDDLKTLVKALYVYNQAANIYFTSAE